MYISSKEKEQNPQGEKKLKLNIPLKNVQEGKE